MGCHFSKKRAPPPSSSLNTLLPHENEKVKKKSTTMEELLTPFHSISSQDNERKQVFLITNKKMNTQSEAIVEENEKKEVEPLSCNKEEIDAILIQCGRLSRSSSGKASNEAGGRARKRSYDFDDVEFEKQVSRPSPRRRTPGRERSRSREGGRRLSRSPGHRSDNTSAANSKQQQPVRMVYVPPSLKGVTPLNAIANKRCASPRRSQSPINTSRASIDYSQTPSRRIPMADIDVNARRGEEGPTPRNQTFKCREAEGRRKPSSHSQYLQSQRSGESSRLGRKADVRSNNVFTDRVRDQLMRCRTREQQLLGSEIVKEEAGEEKDKAKSTVEASRSMARRSSSRRSSCDLDQSYAALILEDIENYHQQKVAHSMSSLSDKKSRKAEPRLHEYVSLRGIGGEVERHDSPINVGVRGRGASSPENQHKFGNSHPNASKKRELKRHQPRSWRRVPASAAASSTLGNYR
ncbi:hypothetical protein J5N97_021815 [Dioscorea zingiberensis]|uniref:Uncharacterized protein n=1 Tax=Dioscorea zingiberensis TaxID=325984 RepID=A0A9D5C9E4_9LILI|nr:hypothetical protein J5N97_021815 [Dioscorea zingiberensis]